MFRAGVGPTLHFPGETSCTDYVCRYSILLKEKKTIPNDCNDPAVLARLIPPMTDASMASLENVVVEDVEASKSSTVMDEM